jgi:hypothetical protein
MNIRETKGRMLSAFLLPRAGGSDRVRWHGALEARERERERANMVVGEGTSDLRGGFAAKCKGGRKVISLLDNSERRQYISLFYLSIYPEPNSRSLSPRSNISLFSLKPFHHLVLLTLLFQ